MDGTSATGQVMDGRTGGLLVLAMAGTVMFWAAIGAVAIVLFN
jgi:hypothetical protein